MNKIRILMAISMLVMLSLGCKMFGVDRNEDGSFDVETTLSLQMIQATIENSSDLTNVVDMQMELRDGYIFVSAASIEFKGITARDVSFHIELGVSNGQLAAMITNVSVSENLFDESLFEEFNQKIAERLSQAGKENERAELVSVSVKPEGVTLTWRVDTSLGE